MANSREDPIVAVLALPGGGRLGLMRAPGRVSGDAAADLAALAALGADGLVSLTESGEDGMEDLPALVRAQGLAHYVWPIRDFGVPDTVWLDRWRREGPGWSDALRKGRLYGLHCAAGRGRTGTLAAALLVHRGVAPACAIAAVRALRPGAIETPEQEAFVAQAGRLLAF